MLIPQNLKPSAKSILCLLAVFLMAGPTICKAQTGLYTYDGGFFIRNGKTWTEYRPKDKDGVWAQYTQYQEEGNYFNIQSSACCVSVPKSTNNNFYIFKNGKWEVLYYTKEIYSYFNDTSRQIYCYKGGYFVRDGEDWREYRPGDKAGVWAYYKLYHEEEGFFNINSTACAISVPKIPTNNFFIFKNGKWEYIYTTSQIYDVLANFDFNFMFGYYKIADENGKMKEVNSPARISISRNGKGQLSNSDKTYDFTFSEICIMNFRNSTNEMGLRIELPNNKFLQFFLNEWCMINNKPTFPFMDFMDLKNPSALDQVKDLIRQKKFFKK